ncbi:MAG: LLM class flavin-dependent oxidoreductase [Acidothermales bacterium]|nr:LLM class flavin-dependent oxidoreductase [Acidothermales bacterium]
MRYGFVLPHGGARTAADLARVAEDAGWDGFFVWEPVWGYDAWVLLTAAAMRTERIRLGTMLTPLSRMRPWKLASETVTLDHLSGGRVVIAVGLGALDSGFAAFGEETDRRQRARLLDEGLDVLTGLWRGQPFEYAGTHYRVRPSEFLPPPPPVQQPRIPIWVVGAWPSPKSLGRALRYDGVLPTVIGDEGVRQATPDEVRELTGYVRRVRGEGPFDVVVEGETPGDDQEAAAEQVRTWADAGATWWIEGRWDVIGRPDAVDLVRERLQQGPPRLPGDQD